jgi:hypothetical protein
MVTKYRAHAISCVNFPVDDNHPIESADFLYTRREEFRNQNDTRDLTCPSNFHKPSIVTSRGEDYARESADDSITRASQGAQNHREFACNSEGLVLGHDASLHGLTVRMSPRG